jgi:hypothetical protein
MLALKVTSRIVVSRLGATFPKDMDGPEWKSLWPDLQALDGSLNWIIGDWINAGIELYSKKAISNPLLTKTENTLNAHFHGEKYAYALDATDWEYQRLRDAAYVCRKIPLSLRNDKLAWSHYVALAPLAPKAQAKFLALAIKDKLTVSQLRIAIRSASAEIEAGPSLAPIGFIPAAWVSEGLRCIRHLNPQDWDEPRRQALRAQLRPIVQLYDSLES